jgi:peptide-methionine (S)-S-oxide reductase
MTVVDREVTTLGAGCFWCVEAIFEQLTGVEKVESGYSGGTVVDPTYEEVCTGSTGHAEVVQVTFDPRIITFEEILHVFFTTHDPTTLNRQGADIGTQYRSAIFYHSDDQRAIAEKVMSEISTAGIWNDPIVTELVPFSAFYRAEDYHQEYFRQNPGQSYCQVVIAPKVTKFRKQYVGKLKRM